MVAIERRRFTVVEFNLMGTAGIFTEDDRVELIDGEIVTMSPIGDPHVGCSIALTDILNQDTRTYAMVSVNNPLRLSAMSETLPDFVLISRDAPPMVPTPALTLLVIEISDESLEYDRQVKLPLYAVADIRETWIVDLVGEILERHSDPLNGVYQRVARAHRGESLASTIVPEMVLSVDAVLG